MDWITPIALIVAVAAAASAGALFKPGTWYDDLAKPDWTPPKWLFPVAWTVLYLAMVWAAWRVSEYEVALAGPSVVAPALSLFAAQIVLNAIWSPIFFGLHRIGLALVVIGTLWVTVALLVIAYLRADLVAVVLTLPYLVWLSYAAALNAWIWRANRG